GSTWYCLPRPRGKIVLSFLRRNGDDMRYVVLLVVIYSLAVNAPASRGPQTGVSKPEQAPGSYLLKPARVFDGDSATLHEGWVVLVRGELIEAAGPAGDVQAPAEARVVDLSGLTLMPGLIEGHSHVLLHPYSETPWNDQVAHESAALRVARA